MEKIGRNEPCWCGSGRKYIEEFHYKGFLVPSRKLIKNEAQIEGIRESAKINIAVLDYIEAHIQEGITTEEIDKWAYDLTVAAHAVPAPLHYRGYPKSVCTPSMNRYATVSRQKMWYCARAISSTWTLPPSTTATFPTRPACFVSEKFLPKKSGSWK